MQEMSTQIYSLIGAFPKESHFFYFARLFITDMCREKSNEITSVPRLLDKVDVSRNIVTADAMSFQKAIIDKIRKKGGDFLIELKANQRTLRYGIEDSVGLAVPVEDVHSEGPCLEHGRIETRTCRISTAVQRNWAVMLVVCPASSCTETVRLPKRKRYVPVLEAQALTSVSVPSLRVALTVTPPSALSVVNPTLFP